MVRLGGCYVTCTGSAVGTHRGSAVFSSRYSAYSTKVCPPRYEALFWNFSSFQSCSRHTAHAFHADARLPVSVSSVHVHLVKPCAVQPSPWRSCLGAPRFPLSSSHGPPVLCRTNRSAASLSGQRLSFSLGVVGSQSGLGFNAGSVPSDGKKPTVLHHAAN